MIPRSANKSSTSLQHQIHQTEPMCVRHQLQADKGIVLLKMDLLFGQFEKVIRPFLDVVVGGDKESAGAGGGVLNDFTGLRLHEPHDAIDERSRRKILPGAGFLLGGVLL